MAEGVCLLWPPPAVTDGGHADGRRAARAADPCYHRSDPCGLGRIYVCLHEVQQLRPIPLSSTRGLEQGGDLIGNDNSFTLFRCAGGPLCIFNVPTRTPPMPPMQRPDSWIALHRRRPSCPT